MTKNWKIIIRIIIIISPFPPPPPLLPLLFLGRPGFCPGRASPSKTICFKPSSFFCAFFPSYHARYRWGIFTSFRLVFSACVFPFFGTVKPVRVPVISCAKCSRSFFFFFTLLLWPWWEALFFFFFLVTSFCRPARASCALLSL